MPRILVICGPTGVGKTRLSMALASELDGEIVGADSLQIYKHLDIGTAKATPEDRALIPHHVIDVLDPTEECNAADYKVMAQAAIADIRARGKVPIVVGGTGLYIRLLVHGLFEAPPPSEALREQYREQAARLGPAALHERLTQIDPVLAGRINPNDLVRVTRGLEIFDQTGKPLSEHQREHQFSTPSYSALKLALLRPRAQLYERINARVDAMVEEGLLDEYRALIAQGYDPGLKPLQSLGYRQIGQHLFEDLPLLEALESIKSQTRRYAKQQISWMRKEQGVRWALAPILEAGEVPEEVLRDMKTFFGGGQPKLEWANADSYNV